MKRWNTVKAVLTPEQWEAIERHAAYSGIKPRAYLRSIIIGGRVIPISMLERLIRERSAVGSAVAPDAPEG